MIQTVDGYEGLNLNFVSDRRFHVELGTRCNLSCTGCARTHVINTKDETGYRAYPTFKITDVGQDNLVALLRPENNIKSIFFNAVFSDPIYCGHLFETLDYINKMPTRPVLRYSTNASGRNTQWWIDFVSRFRDGDKIDFAIDGLEDTNHLYRVNADWNSIINGINVFFEQVEKQKLKNITTTWRYLVFKHNVHQIKEAYQLSQELGFTVFKLIKPAPRTPKTQQPNQPWNEILEMIQ